MCAMRRTQQPSACDVKHLIGLPVEFHGHMSTTVEVRVHTPAKTNSEPSAPLTGVHHIERDSQPLLDQII